MSTQRRGWLSSLALTLIAVVLVFGAWHEAYAQTTTATIRGRVTNEAGDGVAGADVVATNVNTGFTNLAVTGPNGNFTMPGVQPGRYTILVASPAYEQRTEERTVLIGQTIDLVFRLTPSTVLTESITVVGDTFVETRTPEVATNVTRQQIESLPQNDRNFLNFAALAPGVQLSTDELRKEFRAGAQGASATNVFIDGVSFKNDVIQGGVVGQDASRGNPFPQNAVQEFRVITQNYSAEYQKASSAIITAITRSGANAFSGDVFAFYQDKDLVAAHPISGAEPEYERLQWGASVGGPIIRDRMHFFASYEANDQDREETVVLGGGFQNFPQLRQQLAQYAGTFVSPFRSDLAFGKLSFQPTRSQILDWSGSYRSETDIRGFGGGTSRESAENVKNDVWSTTLRHQFTSSSWLNEASLSFQDFLWNPSPLDTNLVGRDYQGLLRIGGRDTLQRIGQERLALRDDITFSGLNFITGTHTIKVGANVDWLDYTVRKEFTGNPVYIFRSDISADFPFEARWGLGDPDLSASNTQFGIYAQNDWSVNDRLILNLGLRWDYETDMINPDYETPVLVRQRLSPFLPANYFTDGNDRSAPTDMFQPRLGFSYDLFANGRTVAFGGAGRYYDRILFNDTLDERFRLQYSVGLFRFSSDGQPRDGQATVRWDPRYFTRAGLNEVRQTGATGLPEVFLMANDTEVPYSDQWNIGIRQSFGNMVASASYANIRSFNGFSWVWARFFGSRQLDPNYSNVLISSDDRRTWYDAIYLTLDKPFSSGSRYGFNVSYTWSDAEQIGNDLFALDYPTVNDWPRYAVPGTQEHRVVASTIVAIPWDMRAGALLQYGSGYNFNINDFSAGFCQGCMVRRSGEGPSYTTVDLRLEKDFRFGGNNRFGVIAEAFNVFNDEVYTGFQDFVPPEGNPNLGRPHSIAGGSQRRYQFGIRYGF
jgi:hypothetical protein